MDLGKYFRLSVSDAGTGMPADTPRLALEPFFTTKSAHIDLGKPILVVEDDPRVMRSSQARLYELGFDRISAPTADAAWGMMRDRDDIDIVLTDLLMPGKMSVYASSRRSQQTNRISAS